MVESVQRKKIETNKELIAFDENREKTWGIEGQYKGDEQGENSKIGNQEIERENAIELLVKGKNNQEWEGCESKDQSDEKVKEGGRKLERKGEIKRKKAILIDQEQGEFSCLNKKMIR